VPIDPKLQLPGPVLTAQEQWFDANIRHQIGLLRTVPTVRNQLFRILDATEADLRHRIADRLRHHTGTTRPADVVRLQRLLDEVKAVRSTAWRDAKKVWVAEMEALAVAEPVFMDGLLKTVMPVQLETSLPGAAMMRSIVTEVPFEGRLLKEWANSIEATDIRRIQDQIRIGMVQGESIPSISRRVVGTVNLRGANGATAVTRRHAEGLVRTSTNHIANQARQRYFEENADIVDVELFIATLDSRTTLVCIDNDGERFPLGEGPIPPLHHLCRSLRTALVDAEAIGKRPMKPVTERGLLREFAKREGLAKTPLRRADLPRGTKGTFDTFARARTRELIGRTPAKTTYREFFGRQSAAFQDDKLGAVRGKLYRQGKLDIGRFSDGQGGAIPLRDLAKLHADEFRAAGLDPEDFLR
jgi:hypothetical protein